MLQTTCGPTCTHASKGWKGRQDFHRGETVPKQPTPLADICQRRSGRELRFSSLPDSNVVPAEATQGACTSSPTWVPLLLHFEQVSEEEEQWVKTFTISQWWQGHPQGSVSGDKWGVRCSTSLPLRCQCRSRGELGFLIHQVVIRWPFPFCNHKHNF